MTRLIITNGRAAVNLIATAGLADAAFAWNDVLHEGPVPLTDSLEALSDIRADYFAGLGDVAPDVVRRRYAERDAQFRRQGEFDEVALWFERDLYEQLQIIQILDALSGPDGRADGLTLMQTGTYIGACPPERVGELAGQEEAATIDQRALARVAWAAYRQPQPATWAALLAADTAALPHLAAAIERSLQDLPSSGTGLSRSELQMLMAIAKGADTPHVLFRVVHQMDPAMFMGDLSFWRRLDALAFAPRPLVAGVREGGIGAAQSQEETRAYLTAKLAVTEAGRAVLAGEVDHVALNPVDRWLGGTHVTNDNLWRWDSAGRTLLEPGED